MASPQFGITPEKEASMLQYFYRQFFVKPKALTAKETSLVGKTALVTGSNVGLGLETARQLIDLGISGLVLAVRNTNKGEAARAEIIQRSKSSTWSHNCDVQLWSLDLDSYESITKCATQAEALPRLDIAILNAGIFKLQEEFHPETGYEMDVQTNYIATTLLAVLLLPALAKRSKSGDAGQLVLLSSDMAGWTSFHPQRDESVLGRFKAKSEKWDFGDRYGISKLLGQLFVTEVAKQVPANVVTISAVNPGFCYGSELGREGKGTVVGFVFGIWARIVGRPCHVGARTVVHAAVGRLGTEAHGQYVEDARLRPKAPLIYKADGGEIARRLWEETVKELSFAHVDDVISALRK